MEEEAVDEETRDIPSKRLTVLQAVIRKLLLNRPDGQVHERHIRLALPNITEREMNVCARICRLLGPYIPPAENRYLFQFQIPFVLMANQVLRACGYNKFTVAVCPLVRTGKIHALSVDAPLLFDLFCARDLKLQGVDIYDFDGRVITTRQIADQQKDAVFSSFFDLWSINEICRKYNQTFGHYITLLPGIKIARLTGNVINFPPKNSCQLQQQQQQQQGPPAPTSRRTAASEAEQMLHRDNINAQIGVHEAEINAINLRLRNLYRDRKDIILANRTKILKRCWVRTETALTEEQCGVLKEGVEASWIQLNGVELSANQILPANVVAFVNDCLFHEIEREKTTLKGLLNDISNNKSRLARFKKELYFLRRELDGGGPSVLPQAAKKYRITRQNYKCHEKVEDVELDEELLVDDLLFSGTDNGIVTATETTYFDLEKLNFHLDLYNRFSGLVEGNYT